jgi:hypothetical protein
MNPHFMTEEEVKKELDSYKTQKLSKEQLSRENELNNYLNELKQHNSSELTAYDNFLADVESNCQNTSSTESHEKTKYNHKRPVHGLSLMEARDELLTLKRLPKLSDDELSRASNNELLRPRDLNVRIMEIVLDQSFKFDEVENLKTKIIEYEQEKKHHLDIIRKQEIELYKIKDLENTIIRYKQDREHSLALISKQNEYIELTKKKINEITSFQM